MKRFRYNVPANQPEVRIARGPLGVPVVMQDTEGVLRYVNSNGSIDNLSTVDRRPTNPFIEVGGFATHVALTDSLQPQEV